MWRKLSRSGVRAGSMLLALAIVLGVYPRALLDYTRPTLQATAEQLADWTRRHDDRAAQAAAPSRAIRPNEPHLAQTHEALWP
jgi:hypothetical protein